MSRRARTPFMLLIIGPILPHNPNCNLLLQALTTILRRSGVAPPPFSIGSVRLNQRIGGISGMTHFTQDRTWKFLFYLYLCALQAYTGHRS